jgi:excisionase family DNA binding protein
MNEVTRRSLEPNFLSIVEAARYLGLGEFQVKQFLREEVLEAKKCGRRTLVVFESVKKFCETLPPAKFAPPTRGLKAKIEAAR